MMRVLMVKSEEKQRPNRLLKPVVLILILGMTVGLSIGFARAVVESREWRDTIAQAVVSPTYLPTDPKTFKQIPDFELKDRYGRPVRLSQFAQVELIVVNIWATSCPACEAELPLLEELDRRLASIGSAVLITITTNETWSEVAHLFPGGADLRILFDPEERVTNGIFETTRFPETFILDKDRRIRARFDGEREWHTKEMLRFIAAFKSSKNLPNVVN
jgi:cytochrome c biogenesis protein CcmG, thiol:disulfide interchange protein DsbE